MSSQRSDAAHGSEFPIIRTEPCGDEQPHEAHVYSYGEYRYQCEGEPPAAPHYEFRLRREFRGKSGIHGTDYVPLMDGFTREQAFERAREHQRDWAEVVTVESRLVLPWEELTPDAT